MSLFPTVSHFSLSLSLSRPFVSLYLSLSCLLYQVDFNGDSLAHLAARRKSDVYMKMLGGLILDPSKTTNHEKMNAVSTTPSYLIHGVPLHARNGANKDLPMHVAVKEADRSVLEAMRDLYKKAHAVQVKRQEKRPNLPLTMEFNEWQSADGSYAITKRTWVEAWKAHAMAPNNMLDTPWDLALSHASCAKACFLRFGENGCAGEDIAPALGDGAGDGDFAIAPPGRENHQNLPW